MDARAVGPDGGGRSLPSGVVTFLLSDVAGSTRLWEGDEQVAAAAELGQLPRRHPLPPSRPPA